MIIEVPCKLCGAKVLVQVQYVPDKNRPGPVIAICNKCRGGNNKEEGEIHMAAPPKDKPTKE